MINESLIKTVSEYSQGEKRPLVIATPAGGSYGVPGVDYELELEGMSHLDVKILEIPREVDDVDFGRLARHADALYAKARSRKFGRNIIEQLERCRVICAPSVGVDMIDVNAATEFGIPVTNVPDVYTDEVADHTMALILATARRLRVCDQNLRNDQWLQTRDMMSSVPRLYGQTLGLVAFGHVARAVVARAKAFGLRVCAYDPFIDQTIMSSRGVEPLSLHELLSRSDIVSMHAPGLPSTYRLLKQKQFQAMKPGSIFVSTGRGGAIEEAALVEALRSGHLSAAGLDVFEQEPVTTNNPLVHMDNVILTPHVAAVSSRFDVERRRRVGFELGLVLSGRWPMSCVNPATLAGSMLKRWQPVPMDRGPNSAL